MRIEYLADHPELVETVGGWYWEEFGRGDPRWPLAFWAGELRQPRHRDRIPTTYITFEGEHPVGVVSLIECNLKTHPELTPWLAGTYVVPARRRRGIGSALVRHAVRWAAAHGIERLYLYTHPARGLYEKLGWCPIAEAEDPDEPGRAITIMAIDTTTAGTDQPRSLERL